MKIWGVAIDLYTRAWKFSQRLSAFLQRDIWQWDITASAGSSPLLYPIRVILIVWRGFFIEHQCLLRASALTYNTLLTFVPIVAFMLAFLKGLGIQNILEL